MKANTSSSFFVITYRNFDQTQVKSSSVCLIIFLSYFPYLFFPLGNLGIFFSFVFLFTISSAAVYLGNKIFIFIFSSQPLNVSHHPLPQVLFLNYVYFKNFLDYSVLVEFLTFLIFNIIVYIFKLFIHNNFTNCL